jgi:hypothetical protein
VIYDDRSEFWTILVLLPSGRFTSQFDERQAQTIASKNFPLLVLMAQLCISALRSSWIGWNSLVQYVDELLGTGDEIFDLEAHDNLIFDDDLYTRSRRYFWAINCLNKSENAIGRNTKVWVAYRDNILLPFGKRLLKEGNVEMNKGLDGAVRECNAIQVHLEELKEQFSEQRTKAIALRDGVSPLSPTPFHSLPFMISEPSNTFQLFSASAVMESRASTRLGENVKLLTYVSTFYLPLAFCTV